MMQATKTYKGITIIIANPEKIPETEERIRKITAELIMSGKFKLNNEKDDTKWIILIPSWQVMNFVKYWGLFGVY